MVNDLPSSRNLRPLSGAVDAIALLSIRGYQRYLSPHKGFSCAYRSEHGGESCSEYVKKAIASHGLIAALPLIEQRFQDCEQAEVLMIYGGSVKDDERSYREWKKGQFRQRTRREMYRERQSCCSRGCRQIPLVSRCGWL
ncbi:membrane protein insertion efficiency factor YidD [Spirulina subsalsa FACHB-351]|uniref:Membrane protein insertion efficiency factor YidD n=1 Tax=Spirulina subsalsa FACHB-351 TaxID=234711 RepID=A0ABT3KZQ1_9CYAN|nr:membrane protein insertion efficiency factor YidD [Spirulina subsalsa]MCW6034731.1 membrane protein insertion efficiency factor YidD [Spirulina subsalsa FACHB-351]